MSDFRHELSTYNVDLKNGLIKAEGEADHRMAMEAQEVGLKAQEMQLEVKRLEIQLEQMRQQRRADTDNVLAKFATEDQSSDGSGNDVSSDARNEGSGTSGYGTGGPLQPRKQLFPSSKGFPQQSADLTLSTHHIQLKADFSLKEEMERHLLEEQRRGKVAQTIGEKKAVFADFLTLFGEDIRLNAITGDDVTTRWRGAEFKRPNKKHEDQTLSLARLEKRRGYLRKFFDVAIRSGRYKWANPMAQEMATKSEIRDATTSYREFTAEDLQKLFGPNYATEMSKPDWYWPPLIALFSGARLGEVGNLQVRAFEVRDGVKVFEVLDGKTDASKRTVPIHSQLIELGFWDFVEALRARGVTHLIPHRPEGTREKSGGEMWGKWVGRCGIEDKGKVFHSFRSTAITDLHIAEAGHAQIRRTVGHATEGTQGSHGGYIRGIPLQNLKKTVERLCHPTIDFNLLKLKDPTFKAFFDDHFAKVSSVGFLAREKRKANHLKAKQAREAANKK